jgi:hypothetical protein
MSYNNNKPRWNETMTPAMTMEEDNTTTTTTTTMSSIGAKICRQSTIRMERESPVQSSPVQSTRLYFKVFCAFASRDKNWCDCSIWEIFSTIFWGSDLADRNTWGRSRRLVGFLWECCPATSIFNDRRRRKVRALLVALLLMLMIASKFPSWLRRRNECFTCVHGCCAYASVFSTVWLILLGHITWNKRYLYRIHHGRWSHGHDGLGQCLSGLATGNRRIWPQRRRTRLGTDADMSSSGKQVMMLNDLEEILELLGAWHYPAGCVMPWWRSNFESQRQGIFWSSRGILQRFAASHSPRIIR